MKKLFNIFLDNPLFKGSLIVFTGSIIASFGSYLFHLVMGRTLGPLDYGVLESLISLSYFLTIPLGVLNLVIVKYISQESQKDKERKEISAFVQKISKVMSLFGFLVLIAFLALFPLLKNLVKIDSFPLFLGLGVGCFLSIYVIIFSSVFQGLMYFFELSIYSVFTNWSKLILAILMVLAGLRVGGAIYAIVISVIITMIFGYRMVKKHLNFNFSEDEKIGTYFSNIKSYSFLVFLSNFSLISFFTSDIILARYFLPPQAAGQYASLSVLGKIVFFASSPIVSVMFPMVSGKNAIGGNYNKLLLESFLLVLSISLFVGIIYFIFPKQMILLMFGSKYLDASPYLSLFAIFIALYSFCSLLMNFFLSIAKTSIIYLGIFFVVFQIYLINIYLQNIKQIVMMNILTMALLLLCLTIYYFKIIFKHERAKIISTD